MPKHPGDTLIVQRIATDETGEAVGYGSVTRMTRREATDETGETIGPGTTGTEDWTAVKK